MANQGRRRHYRVQASERGALSAALGSLQDAGKGQRTAAVLNTSAGGAGLELPEGSARWIEINGEVLVDFKLRGRPEPFRAAARVVRLEPNPNDPARVRVGLAFTDTRRFFVQLDTQAWTYFNRRRAERAVFGENEDSPVPSLRLVAPGVSLRCDIDDICLHGLCCSLSTSTAAELRVAPRIRVEVRFQGHEPLRFEASVRHLTPFGISSRAGLAFEEERGPEHSARVSTLARILLGLERRAAVP